MGKAGGFTAKETSSDVKQCGLICVLKLAEIFWKGHLGSARGPADTCSFPLTTQVQLASAWLDGNLSGAFENHCSSDPPIPLHSENIFEHLPCAPWFPVIRDEINFKGQGLNLSERNNQVTAHSFFWVIIKNSAIVITSEMSNSKNLSNQIMVHPCSGMFYDC